MRTTIVLLSSLVAAGAMVGLCHWETSRVTKTVVVASRNSVSVLGERDAAAELGGRSAADELLQSVPEKQLQEEQRSEAEIREPLFPDDALLRAAMQEILADASRNLEHVLQSEAGTAGKPPRETEKRSSDHWAFRPLRRVEVPQVPDAGPLANPIDAFVAKRLAAKGLELNRAAAPRVLIRRLSFDIRGLPPSPSEVDVWSGQLSGGRNSDAAYRDLVEHLLRDPAHGEHWARMWLDVARFADSNGYETDEMRPDAYPYRDFVIWAFNEDLPYDRFVEWQVAGDELQPEFAPAIAATGFLAAAPHNTFMPQPVERYDELHDIISTIGAGMLGLSVGCARCHDHFFEPIPTEEYYRLVAVFESVERDHRYLARDALGRDYDDVARPLVEREEELDGLLVRRIQFDKVAKLDFTEEEKRLILDDAAGDDPRREELLARCGGCLRVDGSDYVPGLEPLPEDSDRYARLQREIAEWKEVLPFAPPRALVMTGSAVRSTHVLAGGSLHRKGREVGPGFLTVLTAADVDWDGEEAWRNWLPDREGTGPRSALAKWLTDVDRGAGPLLARVIVNRVWQGYFGRGLVGTPNDFGAEGKAPSHPELLEWLAGELVSSGWRLRHIHRLILTSRTYRQSSVVNEARVLADPENRLLGRYRRKRLTAEMYRDAVLAAAGTLNRQMYGPSIFPPIPPEAIFSDDDRLDAKWPADVEEGPDVWRRTVYVALCRSNTVPLLSLLDGPDGGLCRGKRCATISPVQTLALLNAPFIERQAAELAERLAAHSEDLEDQAKLLYRRVFQRMPTEKELHEVYATIERRRTDADAPYDVDVMTEIAHVLLICNEFLFVD